MSKMCNCAVTIEGQEERFLRLYGSTTNRRSSNRPDHTETRAARDWVVCRESHVGALIRHSLDCEATTPARVIAAFIQHSVRSTGDVSSTMARALLTASRTYAPGMRGMIARGMLASGTYNGLAAWNHAFHPTPARLWEQYRKTSPEVWELGGWSNLPNWKLAASYVAEGKPIPPWKDVRHLVTTIQAVYAE